MNRRRVFGLLAAAPAALYALGKGHIDPNLGFIPDGAKIHQYTDYVNFSTFIYSQKIEPDVEAAAQEVLKAELSEWHEYYHVSDPELAAALATYKEEVG